ncbi:MAG: phospho-sugar mutase [Fastidiosipilaceae bacterium]|nr:phospho-sugar mutase [Clostridiaceae bacterium]
MIHFGTAGLRGQMIPGSDGINNDTIVWATFGIATWLNQTYTQSSDHKTPTGVVIAHDTRHNSSSFAEIAANVLVSQGIPVYYFDKYQPTPVLVYTIRRLNCAAGIVITASHNPKEYNGYKVYNADGIQIGDAEAAMIRSGMAEAADQVSATDLVFKSWNELPDAQPVASRQLDSYHEYINNLWQLPGKTTDVNIVYTPMQGTGGRHMIEILAKSGFSNLHPVSSQFEPDPDFSQVTSPNPEQPGALDEACRLASSQKTDLILATDPDADRAAAVIMDQNRKPVILTGNELGAMLLYGLLYQFTELNTQPAHPVLVKTVVTDDFAATIARAAGFEVVNTLTGFKNICGTIPDLQAAGKDFVMGFEESIGYAFFDDVRDKDGLAACRILAGMAATFMEKNMTLFDVYKKLRDTYGFYISRPFSHYCPGSDGPQLAQRIVDAFRQNPPLIIGDGNLQRLEDFKTQKIYYFDQKIGETSRISHPQQNLLRFFYDNGNWFALRPSGTEPKLKFYLYTVDHDLTRATEKANQQEDFVKEFLEKIV